MQETIIQFGCDIRKPLPDWSYFRIRWVEVTEVHQSGDREPVGCIWYAVTQTSDMGGGHWTLLHYLTYILCHVHSKAKPWIKYQWNESQYEHYHLECDAVLTGGHLQTFLKIIFSPIVLLSCLLGSFLGPSNGRSIFFRNVERVVPVCTTSQSCWVRLFTDTVVKASQLTPCTYEDRNQGRKM
jgi:hypothetical protein